MMYRCDHCWVEMDLAPTTTNLPYFHRECAEAGYHCQMVPVEDDDATTPAHEPTKLIDMLDELVAAAKNEMAADIESSVLSDLPRNPVGMSALIETTAKQYEHAIEAESMAWLNSPFYKIMQQRNAEIRLLYGTMTNYWLVMEHKPQPEGVTRSRINTQQERETNE